AARDLAVLHGQRDGGASELADGGLEAEARPRRVLLEEQQQRAPLERAHHLAALARDLQLGRAPEERLVLGGGEVGQLQEIALHSSASLSCANRSCRRGTARADAAARP